MQFVSELELRVKVHRLTVKLFDPVDGTVL
jgi:hypothetical protein